MLKRERASFPRRRFQRRLRDWLIRIWPRLLVASLFFIGPALVLVVWLDGYVLGITQGAVLCVFAVVTTASFFAQTNAVGQMSGAWGEEFTRDELTKARRRRLI